MATNLATRILRRLRLLPPEIEPVFMSQNPKFAGYSIGEWSYGSPRVRAWAGDGTLTVGRYCSFAEGVIILLGGEHSMRRISTYPFTELFPGATEIPSNVRTKGDVNIGNDVWIGQDALILSGVTIGDGAVVGAAAVVTKSVPAYAIVAGNPARVVRYRVPENRIADLQRIAWWNWSNEKVKAHLTQLTAEDIDAFIAGHTAATIPDDGRPS